MAWQIDSFPSLLLFLVVTMKARWTALKCWKVATAIRTSVNGPYLKNWMFKLDGMKCIWWRTNRTNQLKCIFETICRIFKNNCVLHGPLLLALPVYICHQITITLTSSHSTRMLSPALNTVHVTEKTCLLLKLCQIQ